MKNTYVKLGPDFSSCKISCVRAWLDVCEKSIKNYLEIATMIFCS